MDQIFPTTLDSKFTRRGFVVTGLASGFALAAQPVTAQSMIHTDDQGLTAGEVKIPVPDGTIPAYRPSYRAEAAQDGDKQMLAWFKQYLG